MSNQPLVTIAIPAYKSFFLKKAIASALGQTYQNIEVIVVDDKSPNGIADIVATFNDNRLAYYCNQHNVGANDPSANWNQCLKYAKGDYICILCDDDMYAKTYVETMVQLALKYPDCNVFRCGIEEVDAEGKTTDIYPLSPEYQDMVEYIWNRHSDNTRQTMSEWMIKRSALDSIGGYVACPIAWGSDCCTVFALGERTGVVSSSNRMMYFRNTDKNISGRDYAFIPQKVLGWEKQCDMASEIVSRSHSPYKAIVLQEINTGRRRYTKYLIKHAGVKDLQLMIKSKDIYHLSFGWYIKGIYRNILWGLHLRKKK